MKEWSSSGALLILAAAILAAGNQIYEGLAGIAQAAAGILSQGTMGPVEGILYGVAGVLLAAGAGMLLRGLFGGKG